MRKFSIVMNKLLIKAFNQKLFNLILNNLFICKAACTDYIYVEKKERKHV